MTDRPDRVERSPSAFPTVSYEDWRRRVEEELGPEGRFERLRTDLPAGATLEPLYTERFPGSLFPWLADLGIPGHPPYVRGARPARAEGAAWVPTQGFELADLRQLNAALREDLEGGVTGVRLRLDRSGRLALDSDDGDPPRLADGARIHRHVDLQRATTGIPDSWQLWMLDPGASALPAAAVFEIWRARGAQRPGRLVFFGGDPLGALARDGRLPGSLAELEMDLARLARFCRDEREGARAMTVSTEVYREAGAEIDQELGFALATGIRYLRVLEEEGLGIRDGAAQLVFSFAVGQDLFLEIAKLRAFRWLWSHVLDCCGEPQPPPPWLHASTLRRNLTRRSPWLNLLRVTAATFAAVAGGADSIETAPFDGVWGPESGQGRRLARNTQHLLAAESHLDRVRDPAGGSYFLERLTADLGGSGWRAFQAVEQEGGMAAALASGWVHDRLDLRWRARRERIERRQDPIVGVSTFVDPTDSGLDPTVPKPDTEVPALEVSEPGAAERSVPETPDSNPAEDRLRWCLQAAHGGASIQAMSRLLYDRNESPVIEPLPAHRDAEPFERIQDAADRLAERGGRPKAFVAAWGRPGETRHALELGVDFLRAGGFEVVAEEFPDATDRNGMPGADDPTARMVSRFRASEADVACLCGPADGAGGLASRLIEDLRVAGALAILVVGRPAAWASTSAQSLPDGFVYSGCFAFRILFDLLQRVATARAGKTP